MIRLRRSGGIEDNISGKERYAALCEACLDSNRYGKRCVHQSKKEVNEQFGR